MGLMRGQAARVLPRGAASRAVLGRNPSKASTLACNFKVFLKVHVPGRRGPEIGPGPTWPAPPPHKSAHQVLVDDSRDTFTTQTLTTTTPPPPAPSSKNDASVDDPPTSAAARKNQPTASPAHPDTRTAPTTRIFCFGAGGASRSSRAPPARTFAPRRCGPRRGIPFWEATTRAARRRRARTRGPCSAGGARGVFSACGRTCDET